MSLQIIVLETSGIAYSEVEEYLRYLPRGRRAAVLGKISDRDRVESLAAGLLVRAELSAKTGIAPKNMSFRKGRHGKPYLAESGVQFSLSRTMGAVCLAISDGTEDIGVDIERRDRPVSRQLKSRVLAFNELSQVYTNEDLIRIWVKKESFLKRVGIGTVSDMKMADTTLLPDTYIYECGSFFVGISGKGADKAQLIRRNFSDLIKVLEK